MSTNYKNSITDLIQGVLNHGPDILDQCVIDNPDSLQTYLDRIIKEKLNYPIPKESFNKDNWFIPDEYKKLDIEEYLVSICPKENYDRLIKELELYRKNNMLEVLKATKYIVDTFRTNGIVWGVGRGSSVASYVLFLIGVHKIDSVKYNLPIEEFFKGE